MTKFQAFNVIGADFSMVPDRRGRPKGVLNADAERKRKVIERAVAALVGANYMETAAKFQDEYYGEDFVQDDGSAENYEQRLNQTKYVAKNIRKMSSS